VYVGVYVGVYVCVCMCLRGGGGGRECEGVYVSAS
jgi:hypothetical protein